MTHWYVLSTVTGNATLSASEIDARREAETFNRLYPDAAPHVATRLVPVADADEVERLREELDRYERAVESCSGGNLCGCSISFKD